MISVERTYDERAIIEIMANPEMVKTIAEDGFDIDGYKPDVKGTCWLMIKAGEEVIGVYSLEPKNSVTLEIHPQVLPEHRSRYANESLMGVYRWILEEAPKNYQKVMSMVPVIHKNVRRFAEMHGFKMEGVNRKSYLKGGEIIDQWLFGITRTEIQEALK